MGYGEPQDKYKGGSHPYEDDLSRDKEEFIAAMCQNGETYSLIQVNRENDKEFKQLNQ